MSVREMIAALRRRWYVVLVALLLVASSVVGAYASTPPTHTVTSSTLLMPPSTSVPSGGNPFLVLGGLDVMASVASRALTDDRSRREVEQQMGAVEYTVDLDPASPAPLVEIIVNTADAKRAVEAEALLNQRLLSVIDALQDEAAVPSSSRVTTIEVVRPTAPEVSHKQPLRLAAAAGVLSSVASLALVLVADTVLVSRRRRQEFVRHTSAAGGRVRPRSKALGRRVAGHRS